MKIVTVIELPKCSKEDANKLIDELQEAVKITLEEVLVGPTAIAENALEGCIVYTEHSRY
jgi:hypothetical protein